MLVFQKNPANMIMVWLPKMKGPQGQTIRIDDTKCALSFHEKMELIHENLHAMICYEL